MEQVKVILNHKESRGVNILVKIKWKDIVLFINDEENTAIRIKQVSRREHFKPNQVTMSYRISGSIVESHIEHPMRNAKQLEKSGAAYIEKQFSKLFPLTFTLS